MASSSPEKTSREMEIFQIHAKFHLNSLKHTLKKNLLELVIRLNWLLIGCEADIKVAFINALFRYFIGSDLATVVSTQTLLGKGKEQYHIFLINSKIIVALKYVIFIRNNENGGLLGQSGPLPCCLVERDFPHGDCDPVSKFQNL